MGSGHKHFRSTFMNKYKERNLDLFLIDAVRYAMDIPLRVPANG